MSVMRLVIFPTDGNILNAAIANTANLGINKLISSGDTYSLIQTTPIMAEIHIPSAILSGQEEIKAYILCVFPLFSAALSNCFAKKIFFCFMYISLIPHYLRYCLILFTCGLQISYTNFFRIGLENKTIVPITISIEIKTPKAINTSVFNKKTLINTIFNVSVAIHNMLFNTTYTLYVSLSQPRQISELLSSRKKVQGLDRYA